MACLLVCPCPCRGHSARTCTCALIFHFHFPGGYEPRVGMRWRGVVLYWEADSRRESDSQRAPLARSAALHRVVLDGALLVAIGYLLGSMAFRIALLPRSSQIRML